MSAALTLQRWWGHSTRRIQFLPSAEGRRRAAGASRARRRAPQVEALAEAVQREVDALVSHGDHLR
eukprot:546909-Prymnesium_polylepis.1